MRTFSFLFFVFVAIVTKASKIEPEFNLNQNDYEVKFDRIELVRYNKNYVDVSMTTYKFNRTQPAANATLTFKIDVNYDLTFTVQGYKFVNNEYRHFPLRFAANVCKAVNANVAGASRLKECGNFTGCPILKSRRYHFCNFYPDPSKLPPFLPSNEYKLEIEVEHHLKQLYTFAVYATVYRPIKYKPY